jgi:uncharacterized protein (DUF2236 family)
MSHIIPDPSEAWRLLPPPGGVVWRHSSDARLLATAGYALVLQVAHPTVGAGVSEHSDFKSDPWGRLLRTLDYLYGTVYGGPGLAPEIAARVRERHKQIKGIAPDGRRYHALEPHAFAWVHATLAESILTGNRRLAAQLRADEEERFWRDWRRLGGIVGVRERDLPEDLATFRAYVADTLEHRLEDNEAVHDVLVSLARPAPPPIPQLLHGVWRRARVPAARGMRVMTVGLLPPALRERFGVQLSRAEELELRALCRASRATGPLLPPGLRVAGPRYLRMRRKALARGDVGAVPADRALAA